MLGGGAALVAGPLTPPAGPVAPTFKTLADVQPRTAVQSLSGDNGARYVISQPGSYYLTGNITGVANMDGIRVTASGVSIDLCGFKLDGAGVGYYGVNLGPAAIEGVSVRNGTLANWAWGGVYGVSASGCELESLRVLSCDTALHPGPGSVIRSCEARGGANAFVTEGNSRIENCAAGGYSQIGYLVGDGSAAIQCSSSGGTCGFIAYSNNASIIDCVARGGTQGIDLPGGGGNRVERCKIGQVPVGIRSVAANTIVGNTINANTLGAGSGIVLDQRNSVVEGNHLHAFQNGIVVTGGDNIVTGNVMTSCSVPIAGAGASASVVGTVVTSSAGLTNSTVNIAR